MAALDSPMFRQFRELKEQAGDALLFFRMGDFYELFGDDAVWTAEALELTLTARNKDDPDAVPMCGVPHHAAEGYLRRLLEMGRKVAIADQVEDPRLAKGLVKRAIVRVHTPGLGAEGVDSHDPSWLVALVREGTSWGLALLDATTGDLRMTELRDVAAVVTELARAEPREALLGPGTDLPEVRSALRGVCTTRVEPCDDASRAALECRWPIEGVGREGRDAVAVAVTYAERHLRANDGGPLAHVRAPRSWVAGGALAMDEATRRNLELFRPLRGTGRKGTLVHLVDVARTAMGGRMLRDWIGAPLVDVAGIRRRHDAVEALTRDGVFRRTLVEALACVSDIERIVGKAVQGTANPRELGALRDSLGRVPAIAASVQESAVLASRLPEDVCADVYALLAAWLVDEPPVTQGDGGLIRPEADAELARLVTLARDAKGAIAAMEAELRAAHDIPSLKIRHNGVFGYYIEVTRANASRAPSTWIRKQTIANGERYMTSELKELEADVLGADEKRLALEAQTFVSLRGQVADAVARLQALAQGLAELDALAAFAELAVRHRWVRPVMDDGVALQIVAGRHPVVEATLVEERFVPNDLQLDASGRLVILTGPNMAGKSTLMRQVALLVLLAQAGSFVPATSARVGVCDRIFVRVGASDDLAHGRSTFMVEMAETANILTGATARSLVLLDEIGRGTSTYDGLAIAWAVAEDLHDRVACRGVFATHYHELAALAESCAHVKNLHVAVAEHGDEVVFLRTVREGAASGSYGIQCARIAGMPDSVVTRSKALLRQLERRRPRPETNQLALFGPAPTTTPPPPVAAPLVDPVREALGAVDPDALTPREAHAALYRLRELLR